MAMKAASNVLLGCRNGKSDLELVYKLAGKGLFDENVVVDSPRLAKVEELLLVAFIGGRGASTTTFSSNKPLPASL